jgi:protein-tyrosine-phosphatase
LGRSLNPIVDPGMKTVVFTGRGNAMSARMAAAFFDAFARPEMARAIPVGRRSAAEPPAEVKQAMSEAGFPLRHEVQKSDQASFAGAMLVVTFDAVEWTESREAPREYWDIPEPPGGASLEQVREIRDLLRRRVWRLIAREGLYRMQPAAKVAFRLAHRT